MTDVSIQINGQLYSGKILHWYTIDKKIGWNKTEPTPVAVVELQFESAPPRGVKRFQALELDNLL